MDRKTRMPIDFSAIKARMKDLGFTYKRIEEASDGKITELSLKHFLNKGSSADTETLTILAGLLVCTISDLISKDYLLSINLPVEINSLAGDLYQRNPKAEGINPLYAFEIEKFRTNSDLKKMLEQAHRLFIVFSKEDLIFYKSAFVNAFNIIAKDFIVENCIANREFTGISGDMASSLYSKIRDVSGEYCTAQVILMFLYVLILFDAIFLEEAIASAVQLVPRRKTEKADPFFIFTYKTEKMRNTLIDMVLYKNAQFDGPEIAECNIDDIAIEGIGLMLASCEKCYRHIHGNFVDSEYMNQQSFSAILTKLKKIFDKLGIKLPEGNITVEYMKMNITRFGRQYNMLKSVFNSLNPPRKPRDKTTDAFCWGYIASNWK